MLGTKLVLLVNKLFKKLLTTHFWKARKSQGTEILYEIF